MGTAGRFTLTVGRADAGFWKHELDATRGVPVAAIALTTERTCSYPVRIRNVGARP